MISEALEQQLTDLETRRARAEMDAERLQDMDNAAGAQALRNEASRLHTEFEQLASAHGLDEDNW
ncbi:hypothetical protein [Nesterenkonia sp. K-15-9-6]|uniref:hypothetical protein n=1 Tax=Nesterenkonia sp. K-15-9-6 TaxID=3093918 RepID=UPI004044AF01